MTSEEIDQALTTALAAPRIDPAPSAAKTVAGSLKMPQRVAQEERRAEMIERDRLSRARQDAELRNRQESERAALEPRISDKLLKALKTHRTPCALFLGPTGCGKTSAARWVMAAHACHLVRARDLASASRRHGLGEGHPPEVERSRERGLLVIDDVGSQGTEVATIQDVLDHRYTRGYPTIVTSGLTDSELQAHLGAPYYRRIVDQHVLRNDGTEFPVLIVDCHEVNR